MTRIETFTDAAFAFALTLLVISFDPPTSPQGLVEALKGVPAFLLSAALLMLFWWGHHEWSRRYGLEDGPTVILSAALVFTMLVYVYQLRVMFALMTDWIGMITGLPIQQAGVHMEGPEELNMLFAIYAVGYMAMTVEIALLYGHAWRVRDRLGLNAVERHDTKAYAGLWLLQAGVGLVSFLLAVLLPARWAGIPGWAYMLLPILSPLYSVRMDRRRPVLDVEVDAPA